MLENRIASVLTSVFPELIFGSICLNDKFFTIHLLTCNFATLLIICEILPTKTLSRNTGSREWGTRGPLWGNGALGSRGTRGNSCRDAIYRVWRVEMRVFLSFITGGAPPVGRSQETRGARSQESGVRSRNQGVSSMHNGWRAASGAALKKHGA